MSSNWMPLTDAAEFAQTLYRDAGKSISRKTVSRWARDGKVQAEQRESRWYVETTSLRERVEALVGHALRPPAAPRRMRARVDRPSRGQDLRAILAERNASFLRDLNAGID